MRTNRLTSKTTTPQRKFTAASDLEAQDAAYKKYQQGTEAYNEKMKRYETLTKAASGGRDYRPFFGKESNTRRLNPEETKQFNEKSKREMGEYLYEPGDLYLEQKNVNVPKSVSKEAFVGLKQVNSYMSDVIKPTAPQKSTPADWSNVQLDKVETKKATITSKKGNLKQLKPKEELPAFNAPTSATKMGHKNAMGTKGANYDDIKRAKAGVIKNKTAGYDRERKQFEAYAGAGGDQTKSMFKAEAKQSRQIGAQYRAEGNAEGAEMMRQEAKQYRKAAQFAGKVGKGTNKYFDRSMVSEFRGSQEHAANRNTMDAKIKAAGVKAANNRNTLY